MIPIATTAVSVSGVLSPGGSIRRQKILKWFARVSQFLAWPVLFLIFHAVFKIRLAGRANLNSARAPFVIIANHIAFYDSFLFRLALGVFTPHLPLRFMAVKIFSSRFLNLLHYLRVVDLVYGFFGVFTVVQGQGIAKGLEEAIKIIQCGGNVVMYPEGGINKSGTIGMFKNGAAVLAKQTNVPVLPVSFRLGEREIIRKNLYINIGSPFRALGDKTDIENSALFKTKVEELYLSKK